MLFRFRIQLHFYIHRCRLGLMTHFGALAAAASGKSPFFGVYPQSNVADNKPCPWVAAWATAKVLHPSAIAGVVTVPDRPSPTGKHHFVPSTFMPTETKYTPPPVPKPATGYYPQPVLSTPILTNYCHKLHSYLINCLTEVPAVTTLVTQKPITECDTIYLPSS